MSVEQLVANNILNNVVKKAIDFCKEEANEILKTAISSSNTNTETIKLDLASYNPNNVFDNGALLKISNNGFSLGSFIYSNGIFLPYSSKTTTTPINKAEHAKQKKEFEVKNFAGIKFTDSSLAKIEKIISGSDEVMCDIISSIRGNKDFIEYKTSYRITKEAQNALTKNSILEAFEQATNKTNKQIAGLSLLRLYGYAQARAAQNKITQSQKDKLISILTDSYGLFRDNKEIEDIIKNLSFRERANLLLPLSVIANCSDNYVKANAELKANTILYSSSNEYNLNSNVLLKEFGIKDISFLAETFSDLHIKTNIDFKYEGETTQSKSFFVRNIAFERLDLQDSNLQDFIQGIKEQNEILNKIDLKPIVGDSPNYKYQKTTKLKLK